MPAEAWTESRLHRMIAEKILESSALDYKRSAALAKTDKAKIDLSKDVSSFANAQAAQLQIRTDGGVRGS